LADVTISTVAIRELASRMASATDESVAKAMKVVIKAAETLRDEIGGSSLLSLWDPEGPQRAQQQQAIDDAIKKLEKSSDPDDRKRQLIFLQSTITTTNAFYGQNHPLGRSFAVFWEDVKNAPALLVSKVLVPIVKGAAGIAGKVAWAGISGLWPLVLVGLLVLGIFLAVKKKLPL
jgi:hypothetical protein